MSSFQVSSLVTVIFVSYCDYFAESNNTIDFFCFISIFKPALMIPHVLVSLPRTVPSTREAPGEVWMEGWGGWKCALAGCLLWGAQGNP